MAVLRSRQIPSPPPLSSSQPQPKTLELGFIAPSTPAKSPKPSLAQSSQVLGLGSDSGPTSRRRSLRLASKSTSVDIVPDCTTSRGRKRRRNSDSDEGKVKDFGRLGFDFNGEGGGVRVSDEDGVRDICALGLGSEGKDEIVRVSDEDEVRDFGALGLGSEGKDDIDRVSDSDDCELRNVNCSSSSGFGSGKEDGIRVSDSDSDDDYSEEFFEDKGFEGVKVKQENGVLSLRSGLRISKESVVIEPKAEVKDVKGKGILIEKGSEEDKGGSERKVDYGEVSSLDRRVNKSRGSTRLTREEKGKGKVIECDGMLNTEDSEMHVLKPELDYPNADLYLSLNPYRNVENGGFVDNSASNTVHLVENVALQGSKRVNDSGSNENVGLKFMMDRFKDIARRNASKYAHFDAREGEENLVNSEAEVEEQPEQPTLNGEYWPGPFSTAMKIIRDREANVGGEVPNLASGKRGMPLVKWTPRKERDRQWFKQAAPSLQDLCLTILANNVDAITSLTCVPDVLRHKLTQMLCDSRRMNPHFLDLLLEGSPLEIRLPDCSWLEEDKFEKSFEGCNTSNTTVLQLDLCGHCLSDSSLLKALVPRGLPSLTMVSLRGACRISDAGLSALVSSAPSLRSMNLSQCSLLTDVGINSIADSLGPILRELYLDDCESLNAMLILPGLKRLRCLELLSLRGLGSVSDKFIKQLINANGQNIRELVMANCVKLTDSSLKVIAEMCPQLCVLDLCYLAKLTDVGIVHLANGCRKIEDLRLCRSPFSDDAIAAFLEASGESLKEFSLNNIGKVGQNTTISLSRRCKNLQSLDLSWCRNLTDEALGLIADSCLSLRVLKLFGCTQVTNTFLEGHSNPNLQIIGMKLTPILGHIKRPDFQQGPLHYSAVPSL